MVRSAAANAGLSSWAATIAAAPIRLLEAAIKLSGRECHRQNDDQSNDNVLPHDNILQKPISDPSWKTVVASVNANRVLKTIENAPHFQDPLSLEIQTTETKQGA